MPLASESPASPGPPTVRRLLAARDAESPRGEAFIEGNSGRAVTWRDVHEAARSWRSLGDALAVAPTTRVGLAIGDPLWMATSFLAALSSGVGIAPLDGEAPPPQLLEQAHDLQLGALVTDRPDAELVTGASAAGVDVWSIGADGLRLVCAADRAQRSTPAKGAAVIMATSGTTGRPKIVPLREPQLLRVAAAVVDHHRISTEDRGYCPLPLFHINGLVVGVLSTVVAGSSLVLERRFSRRFFWPTVGHYGATWLNVVPAIIGVLARSTPPSDAERADVRFARSAAAPLPVATAAAFQQRCGVSIVETYGMTEAASQITASPLRSAVRRPASVGTPVGVDVRIVDETRRPVPAGTAGAVEIRGPSVVSEYWALGKARLASWPATDADGWLTTGDIGELDDDGFLYLRGRSDDVINRGGEKIYPGDIEEVLLADARVTGAVVVGRPHDIAGAEPVAFVTARVPSAGHCALVCALQQRSEALLSRSKRPAEIRIVDILPAGPTGKVRRAELRRRLAAVAP